MERKYFIIVKNIDNRLLIEINGNVLYDRAVHNDPPLTDEVEITNLLQPTITNILRFRGYNGDFVPPLPSGNNPWHFAYKVVRRDYTTPTNYTEFDIIPPVDDRNTSAHDQWVIDRTYPIVKEASIFIYKKDAS